MMPRMRKKTPKALPNLGIVTFGLAGLVVTVCLCVQPRASAQQAAPPVAAAQSPGASFVRKNLVVMGMEPPASTLAGGATD